MQSPNFIILYVDNPGASAAFYQGLMRRAPVESSPTFAMFALDGGYMLGLWGKTGVQPPTERTGGGSELGWPVANDGEVERLHAAWQVAGLPIAQAPTRMDFGYTFVALDPDGHRLRVFAPAG